MKKIKFLFLSIIIGLTLLSCEKEVIYPTDQLPKNVPKKSDTSLTVNPWGKFLIIDAVMYVDYLETGHQVVYQHFGVGKDTSCLRWGGPILDIETIVKNKTTYSFWKPDGYGTGKFELNGDSDKYYRVYYKGMHKTIIEDPDNGQSNLGGSARPFSSQTISKIDGTIAIQIQETKGTIEDVNGKKHAVRYWTHLTLKKIQSW
jgi:hypothetical protein